MLCDLAGGNAQAGDVFASLQAMKVRELGVASYRAAAGSQNVRTSQSRDPLGIDFALSTCSKTRGSREIDYATDAWSTLPGSDCLLANINQDTCTTSQSVTHPVQKNGCSRIADRVSSCPTTSIRQVHVRPHAH